MDSLNSEEYLVVLFFIGIIQTPLIDYIEQFVCNSIIGAYTGCNQFRDQLEKIATNTQLYELIIFSDCEGYIGSVVSKKLAQDLEVTAKGKLEERDLNIFFEFKNAFELASRNCCVSSH